MLRATHTHYHRDLVIAVKLGSQNKTIPSQFSRERRNTHTHISQSKFPMKLSQEQSNAMWAYIVVLGIFGAVVLVVIVGCVCYNRRTNKLLRKKATSYAELETDEFDDEERNFREAITEHGDSAEVRWCGNVFVVIVLLLSLFRNSLDLCCRRAQTD